MKNTRPSLDGMLPRQQSTRLGSHHGSSSAPSPRTFDRPEVHSGRSEDTIDLSRRPVYTDLGTSRLQQPPEPMDDYEKSPRLSRREKKQLRRERRAHQGRPGKVKRIIKWTLIGIVLVIVALGAYVGIKALMATGNVFQGNILGLTQREPLKQDANGRSNILIFGTSEDSPDHNANGGEGGPLLTDSIMVLSVNQEKKDAYMVSIPRDLWIKFDEPCSVGYQHKINAVYQCGSDFGENPEAGIAALQKKVGEVLGIDLQYYMQVDYSVVKGAVDAVGGVEVTIESNPKGEGILDRNFDWKCGYRCYYVKYEDGEVAKLDGEHALALARARGASGGYGLEGGNFDREKNQQKIIKALREKAMSVGTLTNVGKVTGLLDTLSDNLRTNIDTNEIQTAMTLASEIPSDAIISIDLRDPEDPLVTTSCNLSVSAVCPVAGMFSYTRIHSAIAKQMSSDPMTREGASIAVLNGTSQAGIARKEADGLEAKNFTVTVVDNAPEGTYAPVEIYRRGETNTATAAALKQYYGVETIRQGLPGLASIDETVDFVVIIGQVRSTE